MGTGSSTMNRLKFDRPIWFYESKLPKSLSEQLVSGLEAARADYLGRVLKQLVYFMRHHFIFP